MATLIIFNPISGAKAIRASEASLRSYLDKRGTAYRWYTTTATMQADLPPLLTQDTDRVIIIGGDGTVRAVAQCMIEEGKDIPIGIVAQGSGNVLATALGIPTFPSVRALSFALEEQAQPMDVMRVNGKWYALIIAGQGYDTIFIKGATRTMKRQLGFLAYVCSFFGTFFFYRGQRFTVTVDGMRHSVVGKLAIVVNAISLKGFPFDRNISPCDGLLNVFVLDPKSLWEHLAIAWAFLVHKQQQSTPFLRAFAGREIVINQKRGRIAQMDGEVIEHDLLRVNILPHALRVVFAKKFPSTSP